MPDLIRFAVTDSPLGAMLVAVSGRGICFVAFDDGPNALIAALQALFPGAIATADEPLIDLAIVAVLAAMTSPAPILSVPFDLQGTAFQQQVWQALREIPSGSTLSYGELAQRIGAPKAIRAVANACAANKLAVLIPCHRVVGKNGQLTGYRWGIKRKAELLRRESLVPNNGL